MKCSTCLLNVILKLIKFLPFSKYDLDVHSKASMFCGLDQFTTLISILLLLGVSILDLHNPI